MSLFNKKTKENKGEKRINNITFIKKCYVCNNAFWPRKMDISNKLIMCAKCRELIS